MSLGAPENRYAGALRTFADIRGIDREGILRDTKAMRQDAIYRFVLIFAIVSSALILIVIGNGCVRFGRHLKHQQSAVSFTHLKMAIQMYAQDYDGVLPPMQNAAVLKSVVWAYVKADEVFRRFDDPTILYLPNPHLSYRKEDTIVQPTVLIYESKPDWVDGSRWVAFLPKPPVPPSSHDPEVAYLQLVKESDWPKLKAANKIP